MFRLPISRTRFDADPHVDNTTDNMTNEQVVIEAGRILQSRPRLQEDVTAWVRNLFDQAGLPFTPGGMEGDESATNPPSGLSVVLSQSANPKTDAQSPPKRKSRRVYPDLAISLLERGSYTHRDIMDAITEQHSSLNRETVSTFASDVQNPRYSPIKDRKVVKLPPDSRLVFEDKIKPMLTVIENPDYARTEAEPVTEKQASSSKGDV